MDTLPKIICPAQINQIDGIYWVSLNVTKLTAGQPYTQSFLSWLSSLSDSDSIRLFLHTGSAISLQAFPQYMPLINAFLLCKATITGVVDHGFDDDVAYILLSCDTLVVTRFGQIVFSPFLKDDEDRISDQTRAITAPIFTLLERASSKGWITEDEIDDLRDRQTVFLTHTKLTTRLL